jgi:hypothetical protein
MGDGSKRLGRLHVLPEQEGQLGERLSWMVGRINALLLPCTPRIRGGAGESRVGCSGPKIARGPRVVGAGGRIAA